MVNSLEEILITEAQIKQKVSTLAKKLTLDYEHKKLSIIGVLNGSLFFLSDLIRQLAFPVKIDTIRAKSYVGTSPKGEVDIVNNISIDIDQEHVLIIDDVLDTGKTLSSIVNIVKKYNPLSIKVCVLLNKAVKREVEITPDYCCFEIEDEFVVGYGLDFNNMYRNLPYIAVMRDGG